MNDLKIRPIAIPRTEAVRTLLSTYLRVVGTEFTGRTMVVTQGNFSIRFSRSRTANSA
jgi:hypothetical protein